MARFSSFVPMITFLLLAAISTYAAAGPDPSEGCGQKPKLKNGVNYVQDDEHEYRFMLRIPEGYNNTHPYRLVVAFHDLGQSIWEIDSDRNAYFALLDLAKNDTIFVAPFLPLHDVSAELQAGYDSDEAGYIIEHVREDLCVDENLVFGIGFERGSTSLLNNKEEFRAIAALSIPLPIQEPERSDEDEEHHEVGDDPIAFYGQHGLNNDNVTIDEARQFGLAKFNLSNDCTIENVTTIIRGSQKHLTQRLNNCKTGRPVWWTEFDGGREALPKDGNSTSKAASWTPALVWEFFTQFTSENYIDGEYPKEAPYDAGAQGGCGWKWGRK